MDYFDLHCDTLYECFRSKSSIYKNNFAVSIDKANFDRWCQVFAIWIPDGVQNPFSFFIEHLNFAKTQFNEFGDYVKDCSDFDEIDNAVNSSRKCAAILSVEGGSVLEGKIENLYRLYQLGIRILTLTWNGKNEIASGIEAAGGLSPLGKRVLKEMNRLGMVADLSHLNEQSFYEAAEIATSIIASHSNCRAVHGHARNLTDEQLKVIKQKKSLVGICFYPEFLGGKDVFDRVYANIYYLLEQGLEHNIAIGSDFDGADMHEDLNDISKLPGLFDYLTLKNLKYETIQKIFFKNAYNFFANLLTKRAV
ncbi:MAG TPA: hypothetical protein GXX17_05265 [Clostridiales bacterium]|nr:hypothetical protein [Clostridiales bacterium]